MNTTLANGVKVQGEAIAEGQLREKLQCYLVDNCGWTNEQALALLIDKDRRKLAFYKKLQAQVDEQLKGLTIKQTYNL